MSTKTIAGCAVFAVVLASCAIGSANAADAASDPCALLPAAEVSKALGQSYDAPQRTTAPRPFANTAEGTDCTFHRSNDSRGRTLLFRIYTDPSPTAAADLFARLGVFYSPQTPVSGLGDKAYIDRSHGLHVLAGRTRFFLAMDEVTSATDSQLKDLGGRVVGRL